MLHNLHKQKKQYALNLLLTLYLTYQQAFTLKMLILSQQQDANFLFSLNQSNYNKRTKEAFSFTQLAFRCKKSTQNKGEFHQMISQKYLYYNYMRKINNKIRTKQQSTFLTQNVEPLIFHIDKRSRSLNPQSTNKDILQQSSLQDLSQRISFLRPFSHFQVNPNLNDQLNKVVSQFKKLSKKNFQPLSAGNQKKFIDSACKNSIKHFKGDLRQILKNSMAKTSKKEKRITIKQITRSKTVQQAYDDVQNESANNLINESKRDKQQFKKTLEKFNNMLHNASASFIENWNINLNPKKIKQMKFNQLLNMNSVNKKYKDQVYFYQEQSLNSLNGKYNFGKEIGMFLKSMDKVMNTQQKKDQFNIVQSNQNSKMLRSNHRRIKTLNIDEEKGLASYFKSKMSRRELIKASIPAPIINGELID